MSLREQAGSTGGLPRKAMLLAAGRGTRLGTRSETVSKCMIPIAGKPILEHNVCILQSYGVTDLVINLHHLPQTIMTHFGDGHEWSVQINYALEPELMGTAGAVKNAEHFFNTPFFVWYGDNLSNCRLDNLWRFHQSKRGIATIALHYREDPTHSGIVALDESGRITRFVEKPRSDEVFSHWVSAGILVLDPKVLDVIPRGSVADFGRDVFPALLERGLPIFGYQMSADEGLWWIDTAEDLNRVEQAFAVSVAPGGHE